MYDIHISNLWQKVKRKGIFKLKNVTSFEATIDDRRFFQYKTVHLSNLY